MEESVRQLVASRHRPHPRRTSASILHGGLPAGEAVEVRSHSAPHLPSDDDDIIVRYADKDLVVVEKPWGMGTVRHPSYR